MKIKTSKCFNGKLYLTIEKFSYYRFCEYNGSNILIKKLFTIPFVNKSIVLRKKEITNLTDYGRNIITNVFGLFKEYNLFVVTNVGVYDILACSFLLDESMKYKNTNTYGVAYSDKTKKYYGFTHRGIEAFGIGDMLFDINNENTSIYYNSIKYRIKYLYNLIRAITCKFRFKYLIEDGIKDVIPFNKRGSKIIETKEEAKQAAINFMKYIS